MIGPASAVRVIVATKPVDFRKGSDGLAVLVRESLGADPFSGTVYVFRARRADRVKLTYFDGTDVYLLSKRLEDGKFCWPAVTDGVVRMTAAQLQFAVLFEPTANQHSIIDDLIEQINIGAGDASCFVLFVRGWHSRAPNGPMATTRRPSASARSTGHQRR